MKRNETTLNLSLFLAQNVRKDLEKDIEYKSNFLISNKSNNTTYIQKSISVLERADSTIENLIGEIDALYRKNKSLDLLNRAMEEIIDTRLILKEAGHEFANIA